MVPFFGPVLEFTLDIFSLRTEIVKSGTQDFADAAKLLSRMHAAACSRDFCIPVDLRWALRLCAPHQIPAGAVAVLGTDLVTDQDSFVADCQEIQATEKLIDQLFTDCVKEALG